MKTSIRHWWLAGLLTGCSSAEPGATMDLWSRGGGSREYLPVEYDTVWSWGAIDDTVLASPRHASGTPSGGIVLVDVTLQRVRSFDSVGRLAWSWGVRGQGPGEIADVRALTVAPSGDVILVDSGNGRLFVLGDDGSLLHEARLEEPAYVNDVAVLGLDQYLLNTDANPPWKVVNRDGRAISTVSPPWIGFEQMDFLQWNGYVTRWKHGAWVFGFGYGNGWFLFQDDGSQASYPYVEHTPFPQVVRQRSREGLAVRTVTTFLARPTPSAMALSVVGDTLAVLFDGETSGALDKYDLRTGNYLYSQEVAPTVREMIALGNNTYGIIDYKDLFPTAAVVRARVRARGRQ